MSQRRLLLWLRLITGAAFMYQGASHIMEMGAPFEGDTAGRGLLDPMPDWVAEQIDMDDYVDYLKAPIGTWDGQVYRISIDGDTHTLAYRTDYYTDQTLIDAWAAEGRTGDKRGQHARLKSILRNSGVARVAGEKLRGILLR